MIKKANEYGIPERNILQFLVDQLIKELALKDEQLLRKELALKEEQLLRRDAQLINVEKELLQAKGLLTARGLLETALQKVQKEFNITSSTGAANKIDAKARETTLPEEPNFRKMVKIAKECQPISFKELWNSLSNKIHTFDWDGPGVKVYMKGMTSNELCVIGKLAQELQLSLMPYEPPESESESEGETD